MTNNVWNLCIGSFAPSSINANISNHSRFRTLSKISCNSIHHSSNNKRFINCNINEINIGLKNSRSFGYLSTRSKNSNFGLLKNHKSVFNLLQKRFYNRPWSRPPSYTQSSQDWQKFHPNNLFVCYICLSLRKAPTNEIK